VPALNVTIALVQLHQVAAFVPEETQALHLDVLGRWAINFSTTHVGTPSRAGLRAAWSSRGIETT